MTQRRQILAWMSFPPFEQGDAIPDVLAWLDAPGAPIDTKLREHFPTTGRVFAPQRIASNIPTHECGILEVSTDDRHHEKHHWHATAFLARAFEVLVAPRNVNTLFDLYSWCRYLELNSPGVAAEFIVELANGFFFGPFVAQGSRGIKPKSQTTIFQWASTSICKVSLPNSHRFVAYPFSLHSYEILFDPTDAVRRILRVTKEAHEINWLSRDKLGQLASFLGNNGPDGISPWVSELVRSVLVQTEILIEAGDELFNTLLCHPAIQDRLKQWRLEIAQEQKQIATDALSERETAIAQREAQKAQLEADLANGKERHSQINAEIAALTDQIQARRDEASKAFSTEVARLTDDPTSLIVLRSLFAEHNRPSDFGFPKLAVECVEKERDRPATESLIEALESNFRRIGLKQERWLAVTIAAAINAGQPVYILGNASALLCEAISASLKRPKTVKARCAAGILTPMQWPEEAGDSVLQIEWLNMSASEIVFGSLYSKIVQQTSSGQRGGIDVVATCTNDNSFMPLSGLLSGPIINADILSYSRPRLDLPVVTEPEWESERVGSSNDSIEKNRIGKWHSGFDALCRGPFWLSVQNVSRVLEEYLRTEDLIGPEELLIAWWFFPRVPDFSFDGLEGHHRERLKPLELT